MDPCPPERPDGGDETFLATRLSVAPSAFVAPNAILVGQVTLAEQASVWYGCVLRGDLAPISVDAESNIQDLTVVHVDRDLPVAIGRRVTIGHRCVIHGCTIDDEVLIGMGAVLLSGCRIGAGSLIAAGTVVREGFEVPPRTLVAGVPAKIVRPVDDPLLARIRGGADSYRACALGYRERRLGTGPFAGFPSGRGAAS